MIQTSDSLELKIEALKEQISEVAELLRQERAHSPIIPLEKAARDYFGKSPSTVLKWAKEGHLRVCAVPNGKRGHTYYFLREQLLEDLENNFSD